ncbi:MAG TPA: cobalamin-independent methionine synthase II family protein [Streptosporangiaceae bacterium]|jgi:5-methyltetrahydropteroyltriglutamate--homocysteine methyltransferase|nr:cobalamin-independent methionine synthase II family protein [Streptosporangiaceae bacterium]
MYLTESPERIYTTHTGSLPRPAELAQAIANRETGDGPVPDPGRLAAMVAAAVTDVVGRQVKSGIDIVSDGEVSKIGYATYVKERLSGYGGEEGALALADIADHPDLAERALGGLVTRMPSCDGPVRYIGQAALRADLDNFAKSLAGTGRRGFVPAASPGVISLFLANRYYPSDDDYLHAVAEAMAVEYRAIVDAGFDVQLDSPDLAMGRHVQYASASLEEFKRRITVHVEALNHALTGIDPDRVRLHVCWGNYEGPHHRDVELAEILPIVTRAHVGALLFENANPRHAHEWRVFEEIPIPESLTLVPGVIDTCSNYIEHPQVVADRLVHLASIVGRDRVIAGADCGFSTFATFLPVLPSIAWEKLRSLSEGAARATDALWA